MSYYPSDFIENLRQKSDLVSLIEEDTVLKGRGDRLMGLCPFPDHNEKTPSFSVSASQGLYHCFGCKKAGNIFTYLQEQRGMDFKTALEYLARREGIELPKPKFSKQRTSSYSVDDWTLTEKITVFFQENLKNTPSHHPVRHYLKTRGWSSESIKAFRLGYAPSQKSLSSFLNPKERIKAKELGLLTQSFQEEGFFDTFRNRLIFPIISIKKQVAGFGARVLDNKQPKYINSRDSKIFKKGEIFYGLNESARYLRQNSTALLVEGYTDFLTLWEAGFKNTVATLGTAFTESHARVLKRYANTVTLVFDGDQAGVQASERSLPILLKEGLGVKFISLPESQDPDDFIKEKGVEAFQKQLDSAQDLFLHLLHKKQKQIKDPQALIDEWSPLLSQVQNKVQFTIYKQRLLDSFGTDAFQLEPLLNQKIKESAKKSITPSKNQEAITTNTEASLEKKTFSVKKLRESERLLLVLCLHSESYLKSFIEADGFSYLDTKEGFEIFKLLTDTYNTKGKDKDFSEMTHFMITQISPVSDLFLSSYPVLSDSDKERNKEIFEQCLKTLKKNQKNREASVLLTEIKTKPTEDLSGLEKMFQLTKQRLNLQNNETKKP